MMGRSLVFVVSVLLSLATQASVRGYDNSLADFPRRKGESDDTARFRRAINATGGGVLYVPRGDYDITSTLRITNSCALSMHKNAKLIAKRQMWYVVEVRNKPWNVSDSLDFIEGGVIDGNGLASCLLLYSYWRYNVNNIKLYNPKGFGLYVGNTGAELVANGVYVRTSMKGLAGNVGLYLEGGDSHYNDIFVLDCTTGVLVRGPSNRLTRVHVWGGLVPPRVKGGIPEMLEKSICFHLEGASTILRDCYADTGQTGFLVKDADVRLLGCSYFNNRKFGLDDIVIIRQTGETGSLLVSDCSFARVSKTEKIRAYEGTGNVRWRDNFYAGNWEGVPCPGAKADETGRPLGSSNVKLAE